MVSVGKLLFCRLRYQPRLRCKQLAPH